jgi:hypothetical protein
MNDPKLLSFVVAVAAGLIHAFAVGRLLRMTGQRRVLAVFALPAIAIFVSTLLAFSAALSLWHFAAYFGAAASFSLFVYGAVLKSLSLAQLECVRQGAGEPVSGKRISDNVVEPAFRERAELLVSKGYVAARGDRFDVTPAGRSAARTLSGLRTFLGLRSSLYGAPESHV